jgi:hypothetical protein
MTVFRAISNPKLIAVQFVLCTALYLSPFGAAGAIADQYYSYHSNQSGCRADPATDLELVVNGNGERWVIVAPARLVAAELAQAYRSERVFPIDVEIAKSIELALRKKISDSLGTQAFDQGEVSARRIKITSIRHGVSYLGMGSAVAYISIWFRICSDSYSSEATPIELIGRNGPDMSTLWHQPGGEDLKAGFRAALEKAVTALVDYVMQLPK